MPGFSESNITLDFPDTLFFRWADCEGYRRQSSNHFKEMDACWYETAQNRYWLIELKDYSLGVLTEDKTIEAKSWELVKKAIDSFCMFLSIKHQYPYAPALDPCVPIAPRPDTVFQLLTIIRCTASQKPHIQLLHEKFRAKFKPYAELFGIQYYAVVEYSKAVEKLPFVR